MAPCTFITKQNVYESSGGAFKYGHNLTSARQKYQKQTNVSLLKKICSNAGNCIPRISCVSIRFYALS